jgi:hypothetical protein
LTLNDYLWHHLDTHHLPLDIQPYVDRNQLSGPELQAIVTRALHIDRNWRRPNPRIRKLTRLPYLDDVAQIQFIGSDWLVVLCRSPPSLSVWRVANTPEPYRAALINIPGPAVVPLRFSATMCNLKEILVALISATMSGTMLCAYSAYLNDSAGAVALQSPHTVCDIYRPGSEGQFYEVHVCGHIIAAGIPQMVNSELIPAAYRLLFINSVTGVQCLVDPKLPEVSVNTLFIVDRPLIFQQFTQLHFKVYPRQLVLTSVRNDSTLVVRVHDLPTAVSSITTPSSEPIILLESLPTPNAEYESPAISDVDYHLSADSTRSIPHISSISFHSLVRTADDYIFHFPLDRSLRHFHDNGRVQPSFVGPFNTHASASAELVCLGETGSRAVWLERRWTSDEYTLMKATFSSNGTNPVVVEPLLARGSALPFELHMCQSLAFEEATGRVCLTIYTGELYILQF